MILEEFIDNCKVFENNTKPIVTYIFESRFELSYPWHFALCSHDNSNYVKFMYNQIIHDHSIRTVKQFINHWWNNGREDHRLCIELTGEKIILIKINIIEIESELQFHVEEEYDNKKFIK